MSQFELSEQEQFRRNSLNELKKLGIEPYPAAEYPVNTNSQDIKNNYSAEKNNFQEVYIAGRLMSKRIMGKLWLTY